MSATTSTEFHFQVTSTYSVCPEFCNRRCVELVELLSQAEGTTFLLEGDVDLGDDPGAPIHGRVVF